ncbi:MAG: peptide chain release factor N(5)-glutamine methyltransferase [Actinomycetes bacterium]
MTPENAVTWSEMLAEVTEQLENANEARWLCEHASGLDGEEFRRSHDEFVTTAMAKQLHDMVRRRLSGEPLQYVMKRWAFRHLDVFIDQRVLIPRPETELLVEVGIAIAKDQLQHMDRPLNIVDLGTGSGVIGLSMAHELPLGKTQVWLTDQSSDALDVARGNVIGVGQKGGGVRLAHGNWWNALDDSLKGAIDIALCNPPYIAQDDDEVASDVHAWEPHSALYADDNGLADIREVISGATTWLVNNGWLVLEIGYRQGDHVRALLENAGLVNVEIRRDLAGKDRIALAQRQTAS